MDLNKGYMERSDQESSKPFAAVGRLGQPLEQQDRICDLGRFIAASNVRVEQRMALETARFESAGDAKEHGEAVMKRSLAASIEPELLALLNPRYEGAATGDRGRIFFEVAERKYYIVCDPFGKTAETARGGWFGIVRPKGNQQLAAVYFHSKQFQDDILQAIRRAD